MGVLEDIMGKDPEMSDTATEGTTDEDGFYDDDPDSPIEQDEDGEVTSESKGYGAPKGLVFKPVSALPKRVSNLTGREGIKWEDVLAPITNDANVNYIVFEHNYKDDADMKRKTNLCASKAGSIRRRLEDKVPDEDWEITVRTDVKANHVAIYAKYLGELTDERREFKAERKARYQARAVKTKQAAAEKAAESEVTE